MLDPAVRNCAASSGGRRKVESGTMVAPARLAPNATTGHAVPFGISTPTRVPLPTPRSAKWQASAALRRSSSPYVSASSAVTTNGALGLLVGPAPDQRGHGEALELRLIDALRDRPQIGLAARQHRQVGRREHEETTGHLVRRQARAQVGRAVRRGRVRCRARPGYRRDHLVALGVGNAEHHRREPPVRRSARASTSSGDTFAPAVLIIEPRRPWK